MKFLVIWIYPTLIFHCFLANSHFKSIFSWSQRLYNIQKQKIHEENAICKSFITMQQLERFKEKNKPHNNPIHFDKDVEEKCNRYLKEHRLAEIAREDQLQKNMKEEKTKEIYRTRLASLFSSSVLRDFLTMRYK